MVGSNASKVPFTVAAICHPCALMVEPLAATFGVVNANSLPAHTAAGAVMSPITGASFTVMATALLVDVPHSLVTA